MTTRAQHGIFMPRKLFNFNVSIENFISQFPSNLIQALKDPN